MTAFLEVIQPGAYTTVQDRGRFGYQRFGVPPVGMLDARAGEIAGMLVGNRGGEAVLEFTFFGATLEVLAEGTIALTGAEMPLTINGAARASWRAHAVSPGDTVVVGQAEGGCRGYLAVSGGIDVPEVMGSRSTYVGAGIGGHEGRALEAGDILRRGALPGDGAEKGRARKLPAAFKPRYGGTIELRAVRGPQDDFFDEGLRRFFESTYTVTPQANRMGYRLDGEAVVQREGMPKSIISEPSLPGGVQIPEDGQPIVLLVEQTVGGYTKVATVISADLPKVAQAVPGDEVRFREVGIEEAHEIHRRERERMERLREAILSGEVPWAGLGGEGGEDRGVFCPKIFTGEMLFDVLNRELLQI